ncbi:hypothetical protein SO694_00102097 [Aureococcus anophagefferens]|uniref:C2 domain-containing protein n=1 Tax=Aureococcus anophagefferens TaxID=44056 RepID=A0ABR1FN68_AURAN
MAPPVEYGGGGDGARVGSPGAGFEQACAIIADDKAAASAAKAAMDRLDGKKYGGYVEVTLLGAKGVPYDKSMFSMLTKAPRGEVRLLYKNQEAADPLEFEVQCDAAKRHDPSKATVAFDDLANREPEFWRALERNKEPAGELRLGVWFATKRADAEPQGLAPLARPPQGRGVIDLTVHSAAGLRAANAGGMFGGMFGGDKVDSDPYVVVKNLEGDHESEHVPKTLSPEWNFRVKAAIPDVARNVLVAVYSKASMFGSPTCLGAVVLKPKLLANKSVKGEFKVLKYGGARDALGTMTVSVFIGARPRAEDLAATKKQVEDGEVQREMHAGEDGEADDGVGADDEDDEGFASSIFTCARDASAEAKGEVKDEALGAIKDLVLGLLG